MYSQNRDVWIHGQFESRTSQAFLRHAFDPAAHHGFMDFQSNLFRPLSETARLPRPFIEPQRPISAAERGRWMCHVAVSALRRKVGVTRRRLARSRKSDRLENRLVEALAPVEASTHAREMLRLRGSHRRYVPRPPSFSTE